LDNVFSEGGGYLMKKETYNLPKGKSGGSTLILLLFPSAHMGVGGAKL